MQIELKKNKKEEHIWRKSVKMALSRNHERRPSMLFFDFIQEMLRIQNVKEKKLCRKKQTQREIS